jgi:DNA uptake protein ComE-like DNA-binding protein
MAQIKLKRLTIVNGNPYHAGIYEENYLPDSIKKDPSLIEEIDQDISTPDYQNTLKTQSIDIGSAKPNSEKISFSGEPAKVMTEERVNKEKIDINTATVDQLASLDGVTVANAQKIVEEREKAKFTEIADLDKRVALKGSRKWESLSDRIILSTNESS